MANPFPIDIREGYMKQPLMPMALHRRQAALVLPRLKHNKFYWSIVIRLKSGMPNLLVFQDKQLID